MKTAPSARSQSERADQTKSRILAAAIREFSLNGLAGARTEQISEAAGVNKALLYYYFKSKESLYAAALESAVEEVRDTSIALLEKDASVGERFVQMVLNNFDRSHAHPALRTLMQQEMVRLHRGEENRLEHMAQKMFRPLWVKIEEMLKEGITSGELIPVDPSQIRYATLGANLFYFLAAPLTQLVYGKNPMAHSELKRRRKLVIEYLGQTIFINRRHGASVAARVLAATPMPCTENIHDQARNESPRKQTQIHKKKM